MSTYYAASPGFTKGVEHMSLQQLAKSRYGDLSDRFRARQPLGAGIRRGRKCGDMPGPEHRGLISKLVSKGNSAPVNTERSRSHHSGWQNWN